MAGREIRHVHPLGLYALPAGSYAGRESGGNAEWIMHDLHIPPEEYRTLAGRFDPVDFDADAIVRLCREAGMRYIVFTAKHHDGFAMYHSRASRYNIVDATPFGRDVAMELKQACDRHGVRLCFYYSQAQDWDCPGGLEEGKAVSPEAFQGYLEEKCLPQVRELLEGYGPLGLIWYDTPMDMPRADCLRMRDLVRTLQPDCLVSGRVGHALGDYMTTGDDFIPLLAYGGPFEVPATMNGTWGYAAGRRRWSGRKRWCAIWCASSAGVATTCSMSARTRGATSPGKRGGAARHGRIHAPERGEHL